MALAPGTVGLVFLGTGAALLFLLREPIAHPEKPGSRGFALAVIGISLWPLSHGLNYFVSGLELSIGLWNVRLFAASLLSVGWFLLAIDVTSQGFPSKYLTVPLSGYLVVEQVLAWTNSIHHLVLEPGTAIDGTILLPAYGPWFWVQASINYGLILGATALLTAEWARSNGLRRTQTAVLVAAVVPPALANCLTIFDVVNTTHDLTPFGLAGSGLLLTWALYRADFLDIVPIGRQAAMAEMDDAVVTLDDEDRVVDCNRAARELFEVDGRPVGTPAQEFFSATPAPVRRRFADLDDVDTEISATMDGEQRHFSLSISPIGADSSAAGRVIVLRDITPLKRRERALEAREEDLDLLRQVLSRVLRHNIRNQLTTIQGYAELLDDEVGPSGEEWIEGIHLASEDLLRISEKARHVERIVDAADPLSYDLRAVADDAVAEVRARCPEATIDVHGPDACRVTASPGLDAAVENLVENAVEHNDCEPHVRVTIEERADGHSLTVTDDGPGVPDHEIAVLEDARETPLSHGSGLGLWLVKWVADQSGADLDFESSEDGSSVTIRFVAGGGRSIA